MATELERSTNIQQQNRGSVLKEGPSYQESMRREVHTIINADHDYGKVDPPQIIEKEPEVPQEQTWLTEEKAEKVTVFEPEQDLGNYMYENEDYKLYANQDEFLYRQKTDLSQFYSVQEYPQNVNYMKPPEMYLVDVLPHTNGEGLAALKSEDPYTDRMYTLNGTSPQSSTSSRDGERQGAQILNLSGPRNTSVLTFNDRGEMLGFDHSPSPNGQLHSLESTSPILHQQSALQCLSAANGLHPVSPHQNNTSDCDNQV